MLKNNEQRRDIHKLPSDGYLILPISMSRMAKNKGQSPEECYEIIKFFEKKVTNFGIDFIFLYTNGLYYNNNETALSVRKKTTMSMIEHKNKILKLLHKSKKYIPQTAHFIPWDYIVLNSPVYQDFYLKLQSVQKRDKNFRKILMEDLNGREETEANLNFLMEEIVVTHIIREGFIDFPKTLVKKDKFRLVIYPGIHLQADEYQSKNNLLPKSKENPNQFGNGQYDFNSKVYYDFLVN